MYSKEKPEPFKTDHRNTPLKVGSRVAYNRSGDVEIGEILSFHSEWKKDKYSKYVDPQGRVMWRHYFSLEIKNENGGISTVKNYKSFLII